MDKAKYKEIFKYPDLRSRMYDYQDLYFKDMTLQEESILDKLAKAYYEDDDGKMKACIFDVCGDNPLEFTLHDWFIVYDDGKYKLDKNIDGLCDLKNKTPI